MLVESVPNVSEGRRPEVVLRLAAALTAVPGVFLLDHTSDASHNRSVFTVAGEHEAVVAGLEGLVGTAIDEIAMDEHTGEHPRIGAVDVIPFVPLGDTTMDECVELARGIRRSGSPSASTCRSTSTPGPRRAPDRVELADIGAAAVRGPGRDRCRTAEHARTSGRRGCTPRRAQSPSAPDRS